MSLTSYKGALSGIILGILAVSMFCGIGAHHMMMANMSLNCGVSSFLTTLPQPLQGKGMFLALLGFLVLIIYSVMKVHDKEDNLRKAYSNTFVGSKINIFDHFLELFRRGILNPKIFELAFVNP